VFAFDAEERLFWHYVPMARRGVTFGEMDETQRTAAKELLRTALSEAGYRKVETIRALETVLQEIENDPSGRTATRSATTSPFSASRRRRGRGHSV
jgi:hypothetical protein